MSGKSKAAGNSPRRAQAAKARPGPSAKSAAARAQQRRAAHRRTAVRWGGGLLAAVLVVIGLLAVFNHAKNKNGGVGAYPYQSAAPGIGAAAPAFDLASTSGGKVSLASLRGRTVLLFFQEGLTCQPCFDQIKELEADAAQVKAAGIDETISITSDPVDLLAQKARDMGLSTPVLSDPDMAVSKQYNANLYGMMDQARDGHTFVLVGPDGVIRWRADYGGPPNYTMNVPTANLLADLKAGEKQ